MAGPGDPGSQVSGTLKGRQLNWDKRDAEYRFTFNVSICVKISFIFLNE